MSTVEPTWLVPDESAEAPEDEAPWLVIFLNLFLVLLAMFIAMVSSKHFGEKRGEDPKPATAVTTATKEANAAELRARLVKELGALGMKQADVDIYRGQPRIVLPSNVFFDSARASLGPEAQARLTQVAKMLKGIDRTILVEGHTDDQPIHSRRFSSNWELSAARALAVVRLFIAAGVPEGRLELVGYGEFQPRVPNSSAHNRRLNRRIEIKLR